MTTPDTELTYAVDGHPCTRDEWIAYADASTAPSTPAPVVGAGAGRVWSPMQSAVFAAVGPGTSGHVVVEALAGSGKSTTTVEAVNRTPPESTVLALAFNRAIVDALKPKLPADTECLSFHGFGLRVCSGAFGRREVDGDLTMTRLKGALGEGWGTFDARKAAAKVVGFAKGSLIAHDDLRALDAVADAQGIDFPRNWDRMTILRAASDVMRASLQATSGPLDFDDMIWLPVVRDLPIPEFDFVFVDEAQDLNPCQLEIARRAAGRGGRIVMVGDRRQAIYGFRGADREAIPRMIRELDATVLPLSITYRCPRAVVREAQALVPELQASPTAAEGEVRSATLDTLIAQAAPGDVVISRTNAPLVSLAFRWIAEGRRAQIRGRDLGKGLVSWIKASKAQNVPQLVGRIATWQRDEHARLEAAERSTDAVDDKAACLQALCEGRSSVADVIAHCERLFADDGGRGAIVLTSAHRSKGLEWDRVWLLRDTFCRWPGEEEDNLLYVAITRSKDTLIYVSEKGDTEP